MCTPVYALFVDECIGVDLYYTQSKLVCMYVLLKLYYWKETISM